MCSGTSGLLIRVSTITKTTSSSTPPPMKPSVPPECQLPSGGTALVKP